ncbi:MAG: caspase family protein [Armatimonadetes bacterium]|nr:caspase family protein [Armatimonadota bacterium]
MPKPFHQLTLAQFADLLNRFPFTRKIDAVHMHHTWRPNHSQYKGLASIEGMWQFHTQTNGWSDIAQHITIAPDGSVWTGRNWNQPPASASGHNGNRTAGPFMFEMIGDFDIGRDRFEGSQKETALKVVALVQRKFGLPSESLRFHNQMSSKTCPGSSIDYRQTVEEVRKLHAAPKKLGGETGSRSPEDRPFGDEALAVSEILATLARGAPDAADPADAEPREETMQTGDLRAVYGEDSGAAEQGDGSRGVILTPETLEEMRPYLINLNQGRFSEEGRFSTSPGDVDAIFEKHLPQALEDCGQKKLKILFYAHGGLVSESNGLELAASHIAWWKANDVYPIYFIWETGFLESIQQLLMRSRQQMREAAPRDLWDYTTDPIVETAARALYGARIWSGIKRSAELSVQEPDGGALYTARKLKEFCEANPDRIELHAVGHSAGSNFHAQFIPAARGLGVPSFHTAHFLAPAIRVDTFLRLLESRVGPGKGIDHLTVFTMNKVREQADCCEYRGIKAYRKSLLYLIYYALERERKTPLLGLEVCLRGDPRLKAMFGLGGAASPVGEVVWSVTQVKTGRSASGSTSHGGFDEDSLTLNSVARRVLGVGDTAKIADFPQAAAGRGLTGWGNQVDWPDELRFMAAPAPVNTFTPTAEPQPSPSQPPPPSGGRRRALCVGINRYPTAPLAGCVADAQSWAESLARLGFEQPSLLFDEQATRSAMLDALTRLIDSSRAGDVVVFQYAGHGTTLPDVSGDEAGGDTSDQDEAICPYDFVDGAFLIDDDIAAVFRRIPESVNVTCFIDCCHSGTISRFAAGVTPKALEAGQDMRPRFIAPTPEMVEAHRRFRRQGGRSRDIGSGGLDALKEVLFSACLSSEVAWESGGHGDFTRRATALLRQGIAGMTHKRFLDTVIQEFGPSPRQHPKLYCDPAACDRLLLEPLVDESGRAVAHRAGSPAGNGHEAAVHLLKAAASLLEG